MNLNTKQANTNTDNMPPASASQSRLYDIVAATVCAIAAFVVCLAVNFSRGAMELTLVFDSGHYLGTCQKLCTVWQTILHGGFQGSLKDLLSPLSEGLMLDGPVLPLIGSSFFLLTGRVPNYLDARILIVEQGILQALSVVLLFLLARRFTGSTKWATAVGLAWAFYPSAVMGAGRFLPETVTTVILLALVLALNIAVEKCSGLSLFVGGFFSALVLLAKPAIGPSVFLVDLLALFLSGSKQRFVKSILWMAIGGIVALAPWMLFTKTVTGQVYVTAQRVPTYNLVNGLDPLSDGWSSTPASPFVKLFAEDAGIVPSMISIVQSNPLATFNLVLRKVPRMWQLPWNDFHTKALSMPFAAQTWWHQFIWMFGIYGIIIFFAKQERLVADDKQYAFTAYASCLIIAGHLTYIFFLASARYGFTSMPFFVLFAGYAACQLEAGKSWLRTLALIVLTAALLIICQFDLVPILASVFGPYHQLKWLSLALQFTAIAAMIFFVLNAARANAKIFLPGKAVVALALAFSLAVMSANAFDQTATNEWACKLKPGQVIYRDISASDLKASPKPDWALIIFDSDANGGLAKVTFNGQPITAKPDSLMLFTSANAGLSQFQIFSALLHQSPDKLRQWRAVQVPVDLVRFHGSNTIAIAPGSPSLTIYGGYPNDGKGTWSVPSLTLFSPTKLVNSTDSLECRPANDVPVNSANSVSWFEDAGKKNREDFSPEIGKQFGQYRILLVLGYKNDKAQVEAKPETNQSTTVTFVTEPIYLDPQEKLFRTAVPYDLRKDGHLAMTVSGSIQNTKAPSRVSISGTISEGMNTVFFFPGTPRIIKTTDNWQDFHIQGEVPCSTEPYASDVLEFSLASNNKASKLKDLKLFIQACKRADFAEHEIKIL
jgi:hypothetical protein